MNILFLLYRYRANKKGTAPVMMRISVDGNRTNFPTNIEVEEKLWDGAKQKVKGTTALIKEYNTILLSLRTAAWNYYNECIKKNIPVTCDMVRNHIQCKDMPDHTLIEAVQYYIDHLIARIGNDIAPNTVKKYKTCKIKVTEFLKIKYHVEDIKLHLLTQKFIFEMDAFLRTDQKLKHNGVVKNMQLLKRIIKVAVQNEWMEKDPFTSYSCTPKETTRGHLTQEELTKLEMLVLSSERLEKVRNVFLFCCYTGLAYADVSKLNNGHLKKGVDGNFWIILDRTKSKTQSTIPIIPKANAILDKYATASFNGSHLLPVISNQNLNKYIKEIAVEAKISKKLSMHLARHTFATTVTLNNGVDITTVSKMLGHKNLRTTQVYAKVNELKIAADMEVLMKKEAGN